MTQQDAPTPETITGRPSSEVLSAITELAAAAEAADGHPPFSEQTLVTLRTATTPDQVSTLLERDADGTLLGAAITVTEPDAEALVELAVAPAARRRGVGSRLAAAAARGLAGRPATAWAHGNGARAAALAARHGLTPVRELNTMARDLQDIPEPTLSEGVSLRAFVPGEDEEAWLRVNAAAFAHHPEQGRMSLSDLREREDSDWFDPAGFLLAVDEQDNLLGFHWTKVHAATQDSPAVGEVYAVGISPEAQGRGLGKALTLAGLAHLAGTGLARVILYVDEDNTAAVALYRSLGFSPASVDVMYRADAVTA